MIAFSSGGKGRGARAGGCIAAFAILALGCGDDAPADGGTEEGSTGAVDLPVPVFVGPLDGVLELAATHTTDVVIDIDADPGVTRLEIDGRSVGTLGLGSSIGVLAPRALTLFVQGGLVPSTHRLVMRTPDAVETGVSEPVTITIVDAPAPVLAWDPGEVVESGDALVVGAGGDAGALGLVIVDAAVARVRAWPPAVAGWATDRPRDVPMPGYAHTGSDAAVALSRRIEDDVERLRVAWRQGTPGRAIATTEVAWDGGDAEVVTGFVPDVSWLGAREWTEIGKPHLVGPLVLVEVVALVDTEQPHPGDRAVAFARWSDTELPTPQLLPLGAEDLDMLAVALELRPGLEEVTLGGRFAGVRPGRVEIGADGAVRAPPVRAGLEDPRWGDIDGRLVTSLSAFGSRIVAGPSQGRTSVLIAWLDDSGETPAVTRSIALPDDTPAVGELGLTVLDGAVFVLVPRGDADMIAIATSDEGASPVSITGATCDAIATPNRIDAGEASVMVACLRERSLSFGLLRAE